MEFVIAPLTAIPRNGDQICAYLRADRKSAPNSTPRYSDKPNTFQYAGHDIDIRWDVAGMEATGADLTPEAQRRRGLLTKIVDCLFRGIPWSGKDIQLSDHQIAYVMACNSYYENAFETALELAACEQKGDPSKISSRSKDLAYWLQLLSSLLNVQQTPDLLQWPKNGWAEVNARHDDLQKHRAQVKEAKLRQELGEPRYRAAKAEEARRRDEELLRNIRENPDATLLGLTLVMGLKLAGWD